MRRAVFWRLAIIPLAIVCIYLWVRNHNYISTIGSIASGVSESNYAELPNLLKNIPGTKIIFSAKNYDSLRGNEKVTRIYRMQNKVYADLNFADANKDSNRENRSVKLTLSLGRVNLTDTALFTSIQVKGDIIGHGHQRSAAQIELVDINDKIMTGPRIPLAQNETPLTLRPTVIDPIPMGSFQDNFDISRVKNIVIRFIIGKYPDKTNIPANGKLILTDIIEITNLSLAKKMFKPPDLNSVTRDNFNLEYELRKIKWRTEKYDFFTGVDYPWNNYGWDVGRNPYGSPENDGWSANESKLFDNLVLLKKSGIEVVRIYIFFDLRTGLEYKDGRLVGFDKYVGKDIEALFRTAGRAGVKIIPVLFDFGIADGQGGQKVGEHPELIFYQEKNNFLINLVRPLLKEMDHWNDEYGQPVFALELMNEPENMPILLVPEYFQSLKLWLKNLITIIHRETKFKVTLGSHNIVDMQRWWPDLKIDIWQFHFYKYMAQELDWRPQNLKRENIKLPGLIFCGELEPYDIKNNLDLIKANGYNGVLFWSWNSDDGFKLSSEQIKEISEWVETNQKEVR